MAASTKLKRTSEVAQRTASLRAVAAKDAGAFANRRLGGGGKTSSPPVLKSIPGYLTDDMNAEFLRLMSERVRLGILSALAVNERVGFAELKAALAVTDGNLSTHARKLEDAGLIQCTKSALGRRMSTQFSLTTTGRNAMHNYLAHIESLINHMKGRS